MGNGKEGLRCREKTRRWNVTVVVAGKQEVRWPAGGTHTVVVLAEDEVQ